MLTHQRNQSRVKMVNKERLEDVLEEEKRDFYAKYKSKQPKKWDTEGWKAQGRIDALAWCSVFVVNEDEKAHKQYLKVREEVRKRASLNPTNTPSQTKR